MKCPNCIAVDLLMSGRKGIEIDYCPSCRGVWLDRGELDKFIQQADQQSNQQGPMQSIGIAPSAERSQASVAPRYKKDDDNDDDDDDDRRYGDRTHGDRSHKEQDFRGDNRQDSRHGKRKESFWGNLFDFD